MLLQLMHKQSPQPQTQVLVRRLVCFVLLKFYEDILNKQFISGDAKAQFAQRRAQTARLLQASKDKQLAAYVSIIRLFLL